MCLRFWLAFLGDEDKEGGNNTGVACGAYRQTRHGLITLDELLVVYQSKIENYTMFSENEAPFYFLQSSTSR
jgi:hypothetical protein